MAAVKSVESNRTGTRYAQELSLGVLDPTAANQRWVEMEPNTFADFGGKVTRVARNPINQGRQRKKGAVVNVEANGGLNTDLTQANLQDLLQGFFFASLRLKKEFTGVQTVATSDDSYGATGIHTGSFAGDLIFGTGYTNTANNGLKNVVTATGNKITVSQNLVDETSPAAAKLVTVGFQFATADATITNSGSAFPTLGATAKNLTELGLIPGEWIRLGGDTVGTQFATAANNGFARVRSVTATLITFDKTSATMVTDAGTGKTIQLFKGRVLKNEVGSTIVRRTYTLERLLSYNNDTDTTKEQAEYLNGAVPNEITLNEKTANKIDADISFVALNASVIDENVSGANTLKSKVAGVVRVPVTEADPFVTTSANLKRIRMSVVSTTNAFPSPLFTYGEDLTIAVKNNLAADLALGVLGAFEIAAGTFEVGGSITAYFADVAAVTAVQNNADVTIDQILVNGNAGIAIDIPLVGLGDSRIKIEQDKPIKIPLESEAATGAKIDTNLNHTLLMCFYDYLPTAAAA